MLCTWWRQLVLPRLARNGAELHRIMASKSIPRYRHDPLAHKGIDEMNPVLAFNALPVAGVWVLAFMAVVALVLLPFFPLILRRRRRREQAALHDRIEKAKADILEDGVVEGPKGPYVQHKSWGVGSEVGTPRAGPPRGRSYHGGPWPKA